MSACWCCDFTNFSGASLTHVDLVARPCDSLRGLIASVVPT
jgi:hypothetical protein